MPRDHRLSNGHSAAVETAALFREAVKKLFFLVAIKALSPPPFELSCHIFGGFQKKLYFLSVQAPSSLFAAGPLKKITFLQLHLQILK